MSSSIKVSVQRLRFLKYSRHALITVTMGVATIIIPSTIPNNVIVFACVETVISGGVTAAGGVGEDPDEDARGDDSEDDARDEAGSEYGLDVGDEPPTVMFLTVSPLTVKLYS
jgi:hypothetical protein